MKPGQLSENTASSLGRSLQVLLKNQFSESFLNRILKLITDNCVTGISLNRVLPQDTIVCTYHVSLFSPPAINGFLEYKNALESNLKGKSYVIMLLIIAPSPSEKKNQISIEPEMLFRLLESLVACIMNGAQILKFDIPEIENKEASAGISSERLLYNLIADVIGEISPSAFIITQMKQIQNDQLLVAELNHFLMRSK